MEELLEEMALTGKLEMYMCVGEGSAQRKPFLKKLTTTNINGKRKKNEWATTCREQLKKAAEINKRKKEVANLAFSPDLLI